MCNCFSIFIFYIVFKKKAYKKIGIERERIIVDMVKKSNKKGKKKSSSSSNKGKKKKTITLNSKDLELCRQIFNISKSTTKSKKKGGGGKKKKKKSTSGKKKVQPYSMSTGYQQLRNALRVAQQRGWYH